MSKLYLKQNVFDTSLERIKYLFNEFENVVVALSGGKDSTVIYNLALIVARRLNRLPLKVFFIDQEAEWDSVIRYVRTVMYNPEVQPLWLQCPLRLFNATSAMEPWLNCWDEKEKLRWMREKEPISLKVNRYGVDRFHVMFDAFIATEYPTTRTCILGGVRVEESPQRLVGLTQKATYKGITWGKVLKQGIHFTFYPIYDWSYRDVWKSIHDNGWAYCELYDKMYQHGVPVQNMRVSNVHHETAVYSLFHLQQIEPETWERLTARIGGVNAAGQLGAKDFFGEINLPYMFADWKEYRDYLLRHLIIDTTVRSKFSRKFEAMDKTYIRMRGIEILYRSQIQSILLNDQDFTKLGGFECGKPAVAFRKWARGLPVPSVQGKVYDEYIPTA